jgi:hypothetical protein
MVISLQISTTKKNIFSRKYNYHANCILSNLQRDTANGEKNFTRQPTQLKNGEIFIKYRIEWKSNFKINYKANRKTSREKQQLDSFNN